MKVSIIVPCYKVERYLDRCVESIVNQTLNDIEIILVDDCSPDKTAQKCDEWAKKDSRINVIHKTENEGLGYARNTGLEYAKGEYVAFIDSDDWIESDMMEKLYDECKKNNLDIIFSEFNVDEYPGFRVLAHPECLYVGKDEIEKLRLDIVGAEPSFKSGVKFQCSACKGLYKRTIIDERNLRFLSERDYISEDKLFNIDILLCSNRVKIVPWQLYHYCLNNASLTHSYRPDRWEKQLKMIEVLNTPNDYNNKNELNLRLARLAISYTMSAIANEKRRLDITKCQCLKEIKKIIDNKLLLGYLKDYPISQLPLKWKIYTFALKKRNVLLLYYLVRI